MKYFENKMLEDKQDQKNHQAKSQQPDPKDLQTKDEP